jgi:hypothetical protein
VSEALAEKEAVVVSTPVLTETEAGFIISATNKDGVGLLIFVFRNQIISVAAKLLRAFGCGTPDSEAPRED